LFEGEMTELSDAMFKDSAKKIGLDMTKFEKDMADPQVAALVQSDKNTGDEYQVNMTPTFFIRDKDGKFHRAVGGEEFGKIAKQLFP
jgi:protein-disulfide isomerase